MKKIKKNIFYNILYQIFIIILPLITAPYISRVLGPEYSGIFSFNNAIAHYFVIFGMLGISTYGTRMIASYKKDKREMSNAFWSLYIFQFIISLLSFFIYVLYFSVLNVENKLIVVILGLYVLSSMFDVSWLFFGLEEFKATVLRNIIIKVLSFVCIIIFVKSSEDLWIYTLIMSLSFLISQLILWPFVFSKVSFTKIKFKDITKHIKPVFLLFLPVIATSIFSIFDKIMIGELSTKSEVSFYENAEKIIDLPKSLIRAIGVVMIPATTSLIVERKSDENIKLVEKTLYIIMMIACPMCFGIMAISSTFAPLYYGDKFIPVGKIMFWLAPSLLFSVWGNVIRTQYLIPNKKDKIYVGTLVASAIVNIIFNLFFIKRFGAIGAVVGTVVSEILLSVLQSWFSRKDLKVFIYLRNGIIFLLLSVIMFVCSYCVGLLFDGYSLSKLISQIIVGIMIYTVELVLYFSFSKNPHAIQIKNTIMRKMGISLNTSMLSGINKNENLSIYFFEGIACLFIILIHIPFPGTFGILVSSIGRFAVPLFFIISGITLFPYLGKSEFGYKVFLRLKRQFFYTLIVICIYFLFDIFSCLIKGEDIVSFLKNIFSCGELCKLLLFNCFNVKMSCGHLWYMLALIYCYICLILFNKFIRIKNIRFISILLFTLMIVANLARILFKYYNISIITIELSNNYLSRNWLLEALPCVCLGLNIPLFAKKYASKKKNIIIVMTIVVLFILNAIECYFIYYFLDQMQMEYTLTLIIADILIIIFSINNPTFFKAKNLLCIIGKKYRRDVYLWHILFREIILLLFYYLGITLSGVFSYLWPVMFIVITLILVMFLDKVRNLVKVK